MLDLNGQLEKCTYDAFGRPRITGWWDDSARVDANGNAKSWYGNRFMFEGSEWNVRGRRDMDGQVREGSGRMSGSRMSQWIPEFGIYDYRNRMYEPTLGRFLQIDPKGLDAGDMNLFRYCADDPVDRVDPTGLYGEGSGFTVDQWQNVQQWQKAMADQLQAATSRIDAALRAGENSKQFQSLKKNFEKVFGNQGTVANITKIDQTAKGMITALRDDGRKGYYANAANAAMVKANHLREDTVAFTHPADNKSIYINVEHRAFNTPGMGWHLVHETGHNFGLIDFHPHGRSTEVLGAYKFGYPQEQQIYEELPRTHPDQALLNADTVTEFLMR